MTFRTARTLLVAAAASAAAAAQDSVTFSVTHTSATSLTNDCAGNLIYPASVLVPATAGQAPAFAAPTPPCIAIEHAGPNSLRVPVGTPNVELDALSFGADARVQPLLRPGSVFFSVDGRSFGYPMANPNTPSVESEAPGGDEAASVFADTGLPQLPVSWMAGARRNVEVIDGDGLASATGHSARGLGLIEPALPNQGFPGDDLDALDVGPYWNFVLFSLDAGFVDPCGGVNLASGPNNGFAPAAVLASALNGNPPIVWAPAAALGLDLGGAGTDDLDALAVWDNGNHVFDPNEAAFDWFAGHDMVLFSVRRGSFVIGRPDNVFGQPIEEGDVLMPPVPGGMSPFPGILIPAELLGLATLRSGTASMCGNFAHGDDLDGLDVVGAPLYDCDQNGVEDALDILVGTQVDLDHNGVPDACECGWAVNYCTAGTTANGCVATLSTAGTPSASAAAGFVVTASGVEGQKNGLFFYGVSGPQALPWSAASSSFLCVVGPQQRMGALNSGGAAGACDGVLSTDFSAFVAANPGALGAPFSAGDHVWMQAWFRDPPSPKTTSLTDAVEFVMCY